ncbi:serine protease SP24D [Drosophila guanche]|uniref:trypsin n=1 Tax=Drosophila guanche TaxID=7266 RepID=A0A3B0K9P7_DROGU|nr:serine protease SP24D [Drosophila guanche]SPP89422.1 blast:Serine protease SP24D [Drosophila guanche]
MNSVQTQVVLLAVLLLAVATGNASSTRLLADVGSRPYAISVQRNGVHVAGGALINQRWALTAAHCVSLGGGQESYPVRSFLVRAGSIQRLAGGQLLALSQIVLHSGYSGSGSVENDLALLQLASPLILNANSQPIALASALPAVGSQITFVGWGSSLPDGALSHRLQVATRQSISAEACQQSLYLSHEDLLCLVPESVAAGETSGLCTGDAGSPAIYNNQLVGIASFFVAGCGTEQPDGYVDVTKHLDWIAETSA